MVPENEPPITPITSYDTYDTSSESDDTDEPLLERVVSDIREYLLKRPSNNYVGHDDPKSIPLSQNTMYFKKIRSISTLYRSMYEYTSSKTNNQYLAKVRTIGDDLELEEKETSKYTLLEGKTFIEGHEMESMVYGTLMDETCISKRVAWKNVVPKHQTYGVVTIEGETVVLDFSTWTSAIDFEYNHYSVIIMRKKPNVITLYEYIDKLYKSNILPLELSNQMGMVVKNIVSKLCYLNEKYSFVHCDLKLDNILVNKSDPMDITLIDFDLSSIGDCISNSQLFYSNPQHLISVSQVSHGVLFDVYRLCTGIIITTHVPLFNKTRCFADMHSILCTAPNDPYIARMEAEDSQYDFLNDMFYFNKWYDLIDFTDVISFLTEDINDTWDRVSDNLVIVGDSKARLYEDESDDTDSIILIPDPDPPLNVS